MLPDIFNGSHIFKSEDWILMLRLLCGPVSCCFPFILSFWLSQCLDVVQGREQRRGIASSELTKLSQWEQAMKNKKYWTQELRDCILGLEVGAPHTVWEDWSKLPIEISFRWFSRRRERRGGDHLARWALGEYLAALENVERRKCEWAACISSAPTTTLPPCLQKVHYFTVKHSCSELG